MAALCLGGLLFCLGGLKPPPQAHAWLRPWPYPRSGHTSNIDQAHVRESPPVRDRRRRPYHWATPPNHFKTCCYGEVFKVCSSLSLIHDCKGVAHHDVYEIRDRELIIYINRNLYFGIYCLHAVGFSIYHLMVYSYARFLYSWFGYVMWCFNSGSFNL